ncbi:proenkephalin-A-like [Astyanax mexicanus]|uniref:Proenkephalin-A-like n=1 Tax=Astyanax mexicanus TaxID=7994 RepID=A0A8T2M6Q7_ASTMX|nr:proenkephalin-A-like [Astyanax mexicanus]
MYLVIYLMLCCCCRSMALGVNVCWLLVLSSLAVSVRAECSRRCALCVYSLLDQPEESSTGSCTLACGGSVDSRTLEPCRDVLTEEERVAVDGLKLDGENPEHLLSKKYGGFMKRYGGFMMKKAAEVSGVTGTAESDRTDGISPSPSKKYGGFMKKDGAQGASASEEQMDLLREILRSEIRPEEPGRDLHKRYGGFMRRVGRPQWLDDHKGYGMYKRWDDGGETAVPDKRYGGFMD